MAIIRKTIFVCDVCKKEHKSKKSMDACIKKCNEEERIKKIKLDIKNTLRDSFVNNVSSIENVKQQIINVFAELGLEIKFKTFSINFSKHISNTHECPIGGKTNWNKYEFLPTGYPGFGGYIDFSVTGNLKPEYSIERDKNYWYVSNLLKYYCKYLHMGSGGGSDKCYSCSFVMFFDDFPKLKKLYKKYEIISLKQEQFVIECEKNKDLYNNALNNFIGNHPDYITIQNKIKELQQQINNLEIVLNNIHQNLKQNFNSENIMKYIIPKIEEIDELKDVCKKLGDERDCVSYEPEFGS